MQHPHEKPNVERLAYTVDEAVAATTCSRATLYRALRDGRLASKTIGSKRVIPASSLRRFVGEEAA